MVEETCAICGGELVEEDIHDDREEKIRDNSPDIDDGEDLHALACEDCGHVTYHRS
ncbi:MAG: hypothetical protein MUP63_03830 [Candidatus Nanohaloarchaeota archaeon QJJ-7]|nr:hypothetical protein [Candidatus Nanohaloarchaeota archaeon QJJ-7]